VRRNTGCLAGLYFRTGEARLRRIALALLKFYQRHLRRFHNKECIYTPSCSDYGVLAIGKFGVVRGGYITVLRIKRCNGALYQGGVDYP